MRTSILLAKLIVALTAGMVIFGLSVAAAGGAWQMDRYSKVRLISTKDSATGEVSLGLHVQLTSGWKTYWRNPGEAGVPPLFDWSGSKNIAEAKILWPAPKRFSAFGYDSFGYENEIIWPIKLKIENSSAPVLAKLKVDFLICKEICMPKSATLALEVKSDMETAPENRTLINYYSSRVPKTGVKAPFRFSSLSLVGRPGNQVLRVKATSEIYFTQPDLMIESTADFGFGRPKVKLLDDDKSVVLSVPVFDLLGKTRSLAGEKLRLTLVQGSLASEQEVEIAGTVK